MADKTEPTLRVVDRRWWAREDADPASADTSARKPTCIEELERRVAEQAEQLQSYLSEHRRAFDEFEQVKLRIRRDVAKEVERGRRTLLLDLLEVVDNLDRAIAASREPATDAQQALLHGVELVRDQFLSKLSGFGVARVAALGQPFDAARHEAVTTTPVADPAQDEVVVAVITEGYAIGDEVLRPASVVVGKLNG